MQIYNEKDLDLFKNSFDKINETVKIKQLEIFEPNESEIKAVYKIIYEYIKNKKRKIYGGYALNALVSDKNPKDAIYTAYDYADVEFYSPTPLQDLVELCDILHEKKFPRVTGKEAQHKETYTIFVNFKPYCDISYVPTHLYNKMPYKEINQMYLIHPYFMTIDYLRMFTDPLISFRRMDKAFKRFYLLQKHYPLPRKDTRLNVAKSTMTTPIQKVIEKFIDNRQSIIVTEFLAYNYYLTASNISNPNIKKVDIPCYEFISTSLVEDTQELLLSLRAIDDTNIKVVEYYPFFQLLGHKVEILYNDKPIVNIYSHNRVCTPFKSITYDTTIKMQVGTIHVLLKTLLSQIMKLRVDDKKAEIDEKYTMISHIIQMRQHYLKQNNKTVFDDTPFKDLEVNCVGETIPPDREKFLTIEARKKSGKRYVLSYDPTNKKSLDISQYKFANSSGNIVSNTHNLKILSTEITVSKKSIDDEIVQEELDLETDEVKYEKGKKKKSVPITTQQKKISDLDFLELELDKDDN